ncbi:MAG TPA: hypothetical protein VE567_05820, partial [Sphingomonas sp.]|nr:hypothetical protein [Sphingomonas sp.]
APPGAARARGRLQLKVVENVIENVSPLASLEMVERVSQEVTDTEFLLDPATDGLHAAAHEISLEIKSVIEIEHDDARHVRGGAGGHDVTNTAAS